MPEVIPIQAVVALRNLTATVTDVASNRILRVIPNCVFAVMLDPQIVSVVRTYGGTEVYNVITGALKRRL